MGEGSSLGYGVPFLREVDAFPIFEVKGAGWRGGTSEWGQCVVVVLMLGW